MTTLCNWLPLNKGVKEHLLWQPDNRYKTRIYSAKEWKQQDSSALKGKAYSEASITPARPEAATLFRNISYNQQTIIKGYEEYIL